MLRMAYGVCLASAILGMTSSMAHAVGIGTITDVVNQAYRTPPGGSELPAGVNDSVVTDEALRTGENSAVAVRFVDGSELSIDAGSEVVLSDYVFDNGNGASSGTIELNSGLFHFNSNGAADSGIELQTPVATIGIRGTEFLVTVAKDATVVDIVDGEVEVFSRIGGKSIRCVGGQSALVAVSNVDAICGDYGSFSTAAGTPPTTQIASGEAKSDSDHPSPPSGDKPSGGKDVDPPQSSGGSEGNHSGHHDGTNPGKGGGKGHSKDNGGTNNPGGSK